MKYRATPDTFFSWLPVLMRRALSAAGAPRHCPIRKCRRDRGCTGPLVRRRDGVAMLLAEIEGRAAASRLRRGDEVTPICCYAIPHDLQAHVADAVVEGSATIDTPPGETILEPTRALGARRWRECRLEFEPAEGQAEGQETGQAER